MRVSGTILRLAHTILVVQYFTTTITAIIVSGTWNNAVILKTEFNDLGLPFETEDWHRAAWYCSERKDCRLICKKDGKYKYSSQELAPENQPYSYHIFSCRTQKPCE